MVVEYVLDKMAAFSLSKANVKAIILCIINTQLNISHTLTLNFHCFIYLFIFGGWGVHFIEAKLLCKYVYE